MKLRKIISAVCALAMTVSMVTVVNAASLGGNVKVNATFDSYEKVSDTVAFAYVNVTIDSSAAEALEAYSNELDEITWEEVVKGNGITTLGVSLTLPANFTYTKAKSTIPTGLTVNTTGTNIAFGPKTAAEEYLTESVSTIKLALRVNDFDAKGSVSITGASLDGKNSAESAVWAYHTDNGNIDVVGCSIPSYNEWSTPAEKEEVEQIESNAQTVKDATTQEAKTYDGKYLKHIATVLEDSALSKYVSISDGTETRVSTRTVAEILGGISVNNTSVSGKLAIGVLTDNPDAVFTFKLVAPVAE